LRELIALLQFSSSMLVEISALKSRGMAALSDGVTFSPKKNNSLSLTIRKVTLGLFDTVRKLSKPSFA